MFDRSPSRIGRDQRGLQGAYDLGLVLLRHRAVPVRADVMISLLGQRPRVGCFGVFDSWDSSAAECWGAAYANAELPCQAYTETLVASGIGVEANSKNTMLTPITEDTIMLANARRSAIYLDLKCRG